MKIWLWQLLITCKGENWSFVGNDRLTPVEVAEKDDGVGLTEEIIVFCKVEKMFPRWVQNFLGKRENRAVCFLGV